MKTIKLNFRKGAALSFVIIVFVVVTLIAAILYTFFSANLRQTYLQEKNLQAYYCTITGIELARAALLMEEDNPAYVSEIATPGIPSGITLVDKFIADHSRKMKHENIALPNGGKVTVEVSAKEKGSPPVLWICLEATGTYTDAGGKSYENKGSLLFQASNPTISEQHFDSFSPR